MAASRRVTVCKPLTVQELRRRRKLPGTKVQHKGTGPLSTFVTHGQLKDVARHFFDRLQAELYYPTEQTYPWAAPGAQPAADYAVANLKR